MDSQSRQENPKLRLGILLDDYQVSAWSLAMFEQIITSDSAEIVLIVLNNNDKPTESNAKLRDKISANRHRLGYLAARKALEVSYSTLIERNMFLSNANEMKNSEAIFANIQCIRVNTSQKQWSDYFDENDVDKIRDFKIDVLIRSGFGILRGSILNAAKYGVWSYHHGDSELNRGGPAAFWESMQSDPVTGSMLQILTEDLDNGQVLCRSYSCTETLSVQDNKNNYYWKTQLFIPRKLKELHSIGAEQFFKKVAYENRHPTFYSERMYKSPTNWELANLTFWKVIEKIKTLFLNRFFLDQWILLFHIKSEFSSSLWRYKKLIPPLDRFWADPFVVAKDDLYYIFLEEYPYATEKGHISVLTIDENGNHSEPEVVLDKPYHLSYPFMLEHDNEHYMIPESMDNGTIELYKCVEFPNKWEFQMNLMENVKVVDATLHFHNGKWWMFATMLENEGTSSWDELFLFFADEPFTSEWSPHPQNPVISDCRSARPAGKLFVENGTLYRPSQDCSTRYGRGFNINEVITLNEHEYEEAIVSKVKPNWDKKIHGTHTFNRAGNMHISDAIYRRRNK